MTDEARLAAVVVDYAEEMLGRVWCGELEALRAFYEAFCTLTDGWKMRIEELEAEAADSGGREQSENER